MKIRTSEETNIHQNDNQTWLECRLIKTFQDNAISNFRPRSLTFDKLDTDLSPLHLGRNIPLFIYNFPTKVQHHWTFLDEVTGKKFIDLGPRADLAQNLISSSTHEVTLCQVWSKSTQEFSRYRGNEVKIAISDQVHWPLTDLAPNLISSSVCHAYP